MTITGLECAAAVGTITRQLDFDANLRVRRTLEKPVRALFAAAGVTADESAIDAVGEWIANGSGVRSLDSGSSRLRRSSAFKQLNDDQIAALNRALAEPEHREPIANALLIRQRRRNVHSQVRSVLRALTDQWLVEHLRRSDSDLLDHMLSTALRLGEQQLHSEGDITWWADEVLMFYSMVVKATGTQRQTGRGVSLSTARTYRASLLQFWEELQIMPLLAEFARNGQAESRVLPLFASLDRSTEPVHIHIEQRNLMTGWDTQSPSARMLARQQGMTALSERSMRRSSSPAERKSSMPEPEMSFMSMPFEFDGGSGGAPRHSSAAGGDERRTTDVMPQSAGVVTVALSPDGRPNDAFTVEVPAGADAEERLTNHIMKWMKMEFDVERWDIRVALEGGADKISVQRSGIAARDVIAKAIQLVNAIEELA